MSTTCYVKVSLNDSLLLGINTLKSFISYVSDLGVLVQRFSMVLCHPTLNHHWHNLLDCSVGFVVQGLHNVGGIGLQQMKNDAICSAEVIDGQTHVRLVAIHVDQNWEWHIVTLTIVYYS